MVALTCIDYFQYTQNMFFQIPPRTMVFRNIVTIALHTLRRTPKEYCYTIINIIACAIYMVGTPTHNTRSRMRRRDGERVCAVGSRIDSRVRFHKSQDSK